MSHPELRDRSAFSSSSFVLENPKERIEDEDESCACAVAQTYRGADALIRAKSADSDEGVQIANLRQRHDSKKHRISAWGVFNSLLCAHGNDGWGWQSA